ncbi:KRI1-like family C-terminal-domain-containing protein [Scenedesmus sp. NREL 46B-D3]|nr:KRI1-like family C-terminal-domain-containing protein [Scenedesmus sp. NREL 46B-D3]
MGDDESSSGSDSEDKGRDGQGGLAVDEEEDEQFLEQVDRFEAAYNFRFEEPNSHRIQSFPRVIEDSARRPDERRKRQRQVKAERKAAEQEEREAELRRLKNLKKEEINGMLARIEKEAGIQPTAKATAAAGKAAKGSSGSGKGGAKFAGLLDELLDGDFDPEEYDRRMAEAFDDEYYEGEEDVHELFGDAEEELADEADVEAVMDPDSADAASSFAALRQKLKQQRKQKGTVDEDVEADEDAGQGGSSDDGDDAEGSGEEGSGEEGSREEEGDGKGSKAERAAKHAEQRGQLQRLLEDYYKLDYEDNIGGLACRFKYREVPAESFGLTDEDVLGLSDKQLNQIAGLRLLAPYREDNKRLRPNYKALQSIKGEAAAAAALRRQKREREKQKEKQKKQQPKQHHGDGQEHPQQQGQNRHKLGQQGQRGQHQQQQQHRHKPQHHQQQKSLAEMTAEEKQAARLASYAKLTLKPSKQAQQQAEGLAGAAAGGAGAGKGFKKRKAEQQQGEEGSEKQQRKKQKGPAVQPGRLAAAGVQLEAPLTKAQKKNLLRALKRKEKQQGHEKQQVAEA